MAQKKKAATDGTAANTEKLKIKGINIPPQQQTCVKTHSMTSQEQENTETSTNIEERPNKVGRPPIPIDYDKLTEYASQNIINKEIAEALDISLASFYRFMRVDPDFKQAYEQGMENRKYELERALYRRAAGYQAEEKQIVITDDPEKGRTTKTTVTEKNYVPDTTALIFTLSNRYGDKYKQRVESTIDININYNEINQLSNEELIKLASNPMVEAEYSIE